MKHSHPFPEKVKSMELLFELVFINISRNFTFLSNGEIYNLIFEGKCYPRCQHSIENECMPDGMILPPNQKTHNA